MISLPERSSPRRPSGRALSIYRRAIVMGERRRDIASDLGISRQRVSVIVQGVERWLEQYNHDADVPAVRGIHVNMLMDMYRQSVEEFEKSRQPEVTTRVRKVTGKVAKVRTKQGNAVTESHVPLPEEVTVEKVERQQCGDVSYLLAGDKLLKSVREILGADAPKRTEITGADGGPVTLFGVLTQLQARPPRPPEQLEERPANVIDVESIERLIADPNFVPSGWETEPEAVDGENPECDT